MNFKIFKYESVKSTNDIAIKLINEKKIEKGCVHAKKQTKGKGTYGKKWISKEGNLFLTIFFPLKKNYPPFNEFFMINPIKVANVIKKLCIKEKINLKFPNDIFINKRKVCGILQELIMSKGKKFLIIGIGLNINSNPIIKKKYKATNIYHETKKKIRIFKIINLIIMSYKKFFLNLSSYNYSNFKKKAELMAIN